LFISSLRTTLRFYRIWRPIPSGCQPMVRLALVVDPNLQRIMIKRISQLMGSNLTPFSIPRLLFNEF
jgi:hypothetical protein